MDIFTADQQRQLLIIKGLNRMTREQLAKEIGVSLPTMTKLINHKTPLVVQSSVYCHIVNWLKIQAVAQDK
ncbi:hypothetical protein AYI71_03275 [Limosilactobacillus oris]|nr:hypothetical protein AYI71_03275 [Limosilactobacillus oris]